MALVLDFTSRKTATIQDPEHLIAATSDSYFNPEMCTIAIEVRDAGQSVIHVEGCMDDYNKETKKNLDDADCAWTNLATINAASYAVDDALYGNGLFYVSVAGTKRFRFVTEDISTISAATITLYKVD